VPEDFPTIQSAVNDVDPWAVDTVLVGPGLYQESVQLGIKNVHLISAAGPAVTAIMSPPGTSAVSLGIQYVNVAADSLLSGFTLTNSTYGIYVAGGFSPTIISNVVVNCGTGIECNAGGISTPAYAIIRRNLVTGCSGVAVQLYFTAVPVIDHNILDSNGAGIGLWSAGTPEIRNNIIRNNHGNAIGMANQYAVNIVQNLIMGNSGGGIGLASPQGGFQALWAFNNTVVENAGPGISVGGFASGLAIVNNIVIGDPPLQGINGIIQFNDFYPAPGAVLSGPITNLIGSAGNFSANPFLACQPAEDYHLLPGSPCIDAGTNGVPLLLPADFDGQPRIIASTTNGPAIVDLGAYEFSPTNPPIACLFLFCPSNVVAIAPAGQTSAAVDYPPAFATPGAFISYSPVSGSVFPAGDDPVSVRAVYGTNELDCSFIISVFTTDDFGRALAATNLAWSTFGDTSWFVQSAVTHGSQAAAQSGAITNNEFSTLRTRVSGPGTLTFWWKVSSEANHDFLSLAVNGTTVAAISGEVDWRFQTIYVGSGEQDVAWTYAKNATGSAGQDAGWLDEVSWTPGAVAPFITSQPASLAVGTGMTAVFSVTASGTPPFGYQWLFHGEALPGATGSTLAVTNVQAWNAGSYSVVVMNQAGTNYSATATLRLAEVLAWGVNAYGQTNVPAGLTNVTAIAGGWNHSMALSRDGTVAVWGSNNHGQTNVPAGLSNLVAIASRSGDFCMALRADGTVAAWGDNSYGQANVPSGLSNVVAISAGGYRSLALKSDGTAVAWGDSHTVPAGLSNLVAVSAGDSASLFLRADGTVAATGTTVPPYVTNIVQIAAGGLHNLALRADGTVVGWGDNSYGQISIPTGLTQVVAIAAGDYHSTALRADHTVVVWGRYYTGGYSDFGGFIVPTVPATLTNVLAIAAGSDHDLALVTNIPPVPFITVQPVSQRVVAGSNAIFSVTAGPTGSGLSYQWRFNASNDIPYATNSLLVLSDVQSADAGLYSVQVTNPFGSTLSSNATLQVDHPPLADASATPSTVISTNGTNATVILDGSRSSDPDGDVLQYLWLSLSSQPATLLASGVVALVVLPVGVHPLALAVNDGLVASTNAITVSVFTPSQAVAQLNSLVTQAVTNSGPLTATLQSALASLGRGDSVAAANQLLAFQKMVAALTAPSDPVLAQRLISAAQQVIDSLQGRRGMRPTNLHALRQPDGTLQLRFNGTTGQLYIVEASTNLMDWAMIGVASQEDNGEFHFEDVPAARLTNCFYRVLKP
jgi:parallel beta-helix repeat protein